MLEERVGRSLPHRPRWENLHEDILELFQDAQEKVVENIRRGRTNRHEWIVQRRRPNFNWYKCHPSFYAKQRAQYSNHKITPLEPPVDPELSCSYCDYKAHTKSQRFAHECCSHDSRGKKTSRTNVEFMIYDGSKEQFELLKSSGWL
jgi:hypothetical protein